MNGHIDWNDNITDVTNRWAITLRLKDLLAGQDPAPDSATTDVTPRRVQSFSVPRGATVTWENRRNGLLVQQSSFIYDGNLLTIPGVRVFKDSSRLTVSYGGATAAERHTLPREFALSQNYPNPFNPTTSFEFEVPSFEFVSLKVFDVLGREVATLVDEIKQAGEYKVTWDAGKMASGIYFYRLQAGVFVETKKMVLAK
jgi:hypothetical protein